MVLAPPSELPHSFADWPFFFAADAEEARGLAAELDLEQREILEREGTLLLAESSGFISVSGPAVMARAGDNNLPKSLTCSDDTTQLHLL